MKLDDKEFSLRSWASQCSIFVNKEYKRIVKKVSSSSSLIEADSFTVVLSGETEYSKRKYQKSICKLQTALCGK